MGNGGLLANKSLGSRIDKYDIVVRWVFTQHNLENRLVWVYGVIMYKKGFLQCERGPDHNRKDLAAGDFNEILIEKIWLVVFFSFFFFYCSVFIHLRKPCRCFYIEMAQYHFFFSDNDAETEILSISRWYPSVFYR